MGTALSHCDAQSSRPGISTSLVAGQTSNRINLGPGLLESTYETCLAALLFRRGLNVARQAAMPLVFRGEKIECGYRVDLLVESRVVVELKTVTKLEPVHFAQVMTYLKLSGCEVGLLINFNVTLLKDGLRRVVQGYQTPLSSSSHSSAPSAIDSV